QRFQNRRTGGHQSGQTASCFCQAAVAIGTWALMSNPSSLFAASFKRFACPGARQMIEWLRYRDDVWPQFDVGSSVGCLSHELGDVRGHWELDLPLGEIAAEARGGLAVDFDGGDAAVVGCGAADE